VISLVSRNEAPGRIAGGEDGEGSVFGLSHNCLLTSKKRRGTNSHYVPSYRDGARVGVGRKKIRGFLKNLAAAIRQNL